MVQVERDAIEVVHPEGTDEARRVGRPWRVLPCRLWIEHRVIDDQLAPSLEDVRERLPTTLAFEDVLLLDELAWQVAALLAELVAKPGELLLFGEMLLAGRQPFVVCHNFGGCHRSSYAASPVIRVPALSRSASPAVTMSCPPVDGPDPRKPAAPQFVEQQMRAIHHVERTEPGGITRGRSRRTHVGHFRDELRSIWSRTLVSE